MGFDSNRSSPKRLVILADYIIKNNAFAKAVIMMGFMIGSQSGRGVACGQHLLVG